MTPTPPDACPVQAQFAAARRALAAALIERDDEVLLALTALAAGEHLLLVGPPGLAKSMLLDALLAWAGGSRFSMLLTKFSVPEEVFGPVSLAGLREDRYVRVTRGKLPEADFAFLDELFKASSAILNTLLRVLNERTFDAGDGVARAVPLKLCVAASNEWPGPDTGKELAAVFDRFLLRKAVRPIATAAGRRRLLWAKDHAPTLAATLGPDDLRHARAAAKAVPWSVEAKEAFEAVLKSLAKEGVQPGDRRQFKTVGVVRAYAWVSGDEVVMPEHLELAAHTLWDDPAEQPGVVAKAIAKVANPVGMAINGLLLEAEDVVAGTDPRSLADAAKAAAKLGEIDQRLAALKGHARLGPARERVREQLKRLKLASLEAV